MQGVSIQDQLVDNHCWGYEADNPEGLQLKSYWDGGVGHEPCSSPTPASPPGPYHVLNGGIIATLLDCHGVCTAIAHAYGDERRPHGHASRRSGTPRRP